MQPRKQFELTPEEQQAEDLDRLMLEAARRMSGAKSDVFETLAALGSLMRLLFRKDGVANPHSFGSPKAISRDATGPRW